MLFSVIGDGLILESYLFLEHSDSKHLTTAGQRHAIETVLNDTTLGTSHHTVLVNVSGSGKTITLPVLLDHVGRIYIIKKIDDSANIVTITSDAPSELIDGLATRTLTVEFDSLSIQSDGVQWRII